MDKIKVALILYTHGLQYDDRIRKEMQSIMKCHPKVEFIIFAIQPQNKADEGITDYGVPYHVPYLKSRDKYASATKRLVKAYDFYRTVKPKLKGFDAIWCADIETFMFPLLLSSKRNIIWDLHELPARFMGSFVLKMLFHFLERKCRLFYHANQNRIDHLTEMGLIRLPSKHHAIRNYPEGNLYIKQIDPDDTFNRFEKWLGNSKCVYIQGVSIEGRRAVESVSAILETPDLRAVVVGGYSPKSLASVRNKYGGEVDRRIFFTGKIPQIRTGLYISKCILGLVFYQENCPNNSLCEPNRMFQTIMMGLPVVVGCNKPMKEIVEKYGFGVALPDDGGNIQHIVNGINAVCGNYDEYRNNIIYHRPNICWEKQEQMLGSTFIKAIK